MYVFKDLFLKQEDKSIWPQKG